MEINKKPVRLLRVTIAAVLSELIPLLVLVIAITVWGYLAAPGNGQAVYEAFAQQAGKYVGPVIGPLVTLGMGFWAARKQTNAWLLHGTLTGAMVVVLDLAIYASQATNLEPLFLIGLVAKLLAGVLGGYLAKRRYQNLPADARESHRLV